MHARACPYHNVSGLVKTTLRPGHTHPHPRNIPLSCFRHVEMRVVRRLLTDAGIELFSLINHLLWYRLQTTAYPHRFVLHELFFIEVYFGPFKPLCVDRVFWCGHSLSSEPRTEAIEHSFESSYVPLARFCNH